jgi:hypothetical protein
MCSLHDVAGDVYEPYTFPRPKLRATSGCQKQNSSGFPVWPRAAASCKRTRAQNAKSCCRVINTIHMLLASSLVSQTNANAQRLALPGALLRVLLPYRMHASAASGLVPVPEAPPVV